MANVVRNCPLLAIIHNSSECFFFVPVMLSEFLGGLRPPLLLDCRLQSTPFGSDVFVGFLH
jgi:hypothetical protein